MANKYLQTLLYQLKDAFGRRIGMIDDTGFIVSQGNSADLDNNMTEILSLCTGTSAPVTFVGHTFLSVGARGKLDFICFVEGEDAEAARYAEILAVALSNMKQMHDDKFDKTNFIKNIILDNILPGDIFVKAKELHLTYEATRVVYVVKNSPDREFDAFDIIVGLFPDSSKDFVIDLDNNTIVLVKELRPDTPVTEIERIAKSIVDTIQAEAMVDASVGLGTMVNSIRDLAKSYKEAQIAIEVGRVFDTEKNIVSYDNLGIGRLIYQLPTTLCELFLSEVFKKDSIDSLDAETLSTIQKFFENNLNVSETSRQLYVHRNTLVYRLDKVQKLTGLDLRVFDHAIVFKVAMMVKKYLVSNPIKM